MNTSKVSRYTVSHRWEIISGVWIILCLIVAVQYMYPAIMHQIMHVGAIREKMSVVDDKQVFRNRIAHLQKTAATLDSLAISLQSREQFNQAVVLDMIYSLADSADSEVDKVEIGDIVHLKNTREIPIVYHGTGTYVSMGKLIEAIENMALATRIRQISIQKQDDDRGKVVVDFVIVEKM